MRIEEYFEDEKKLDNSLSFFERKNLLVKKEVKQLSTSHIEKAIHNLEFYEKNKNDYKFNDWLIIILYYSLYHCALALVVNKNFVSKNHSATLLFIIKHYNLEKEEVNLIDELSINKNDAEFYTTLKQERHSANYSTDFKFKNNIIEEYKKRTLFFLHKVKLILNN